MNELPPGFATFSDELAKLELDYAASVRRRIKLSENSAEEDRRGRRLAARISTLRKIIYEKEK